MQVCNLCLVLKKQSIVLFCSNERQLKKTKMTVIFGTSTRKIYSETTVKECTNCVRKGNLVNEVHQKTFNLFFIPFFPIKKYFFTKCDRCNSNYNIDFDTLDSIKTKSKTPWTSFMGLFIIPLFGLSIFMFHFVDTNRENDFLKNPKINDIYFMTTNNNTYSILKVVATKPDSIFLLQSGLVTDSYFSLDDLVERKPDVFENKKEIMKLSKKDALELKQNDYILRIRR